MRILAALAFATVVAAAASAAPSKPDPAGSSRGAQGSVTGTILETMDSGGYTYMKLKTPGGDVWAAVNQAKVQKGATVTVVNPAEMVNFESKTLHRKFERILFGTLAEGSAGNHPAGAQQWKPAAAPQVTGPIKVAKAEGGRTVAEIFAERTALKDKEVTLRGKVVKSTASVMGKNWLHLRDGSGSPEKKNDDITVTTKGTAAVGDVIVVRGVVKLDKDYGAGYTYPVIIEDARVSK